MSTTREAILIDKALASIQQGGLHCGDKSNT